MDPDNFWDNGADFHVALKVIRVQKNDEHAGVLGDDAAAAAAEPARCSRGAWRRAQQWGCRAAWCECCVV